MQENGPPVIRVATRTALAILFSGLAFLQLHAQNVVNNPSMEQGTGPVPTGWERTESMGRTGRLFADNSVFRSGTRSLSILGGRGFDSGHWRTAPFSVESGKLYRTRFFLQAASSTRHDARAVVNAYLTDQDGEIVLWQQEKPLRTIDNWLTVDVGDYVASPGDQFLRLHLRLRTALCPDAPSDCLDGTSPEILPCDESSQPDEIWQVWFDDVEVLELDRSSPAPGCLLTAGSGYTVWSSPASQKVYRDDPAPIEFPCDGPIKIAAARGETEPFQVVVRPESSWAGYWEWTDLTVAADPVGDRKIPARRVAAHRVEYINIQERSGVVGRGGLVPDPLPSADLEVLSAGVNQPYWFLVDVPRTAAPGSYEMRLRWIRGGRVTFEVPVELTVKSFEIPERATFAVQSQLHLEEAMAHEPFGESFADPADRLAAARRYYESVFDHRASTAPIARIPVDVAGDIVATDTSELEEHLRVIVALGGCRSPMMLEGVLRVGGDCRGPSRWPASSYWNTSSGGIAIFLDSSNETLAPSFVSLFTQHVEQVMQALERQGCSSSVMIQLFDAPDVNDPPTVNALREIACLLTAIDSRIVPAGSGPFLREFTDCFGRWDFDGGSVPFDLSDVAAAAAGDKAWIYDDTISFQDAPLLRRRLFHWALARSPFAGIQVESLTRWGPPGGAADRNPWTDTRVNSRSLLYPARSADEGSPVSSLRWEMMRQGLEDLEHLRLLHGLIERPGAGVTPDILERANAALAAADTVMERLPVSEADQPYTVDAARVDEVRREVVASIEELVAAGTAGRTISIVNASGFPGDTVTAVVMIDDADGLETVDFVIQYDPDVLAVAEICLGDIASELNSAVCVGNFDPGSGIAWYATMGDGEIRVTVAMTEPRGPGACSIVEMELQIGATSVDTTALDLVSASLNEGELQLRRVPSQGLDPTDGSVAIEAPCPPAGATEFGPFADPSFEHAHAVGEECAGAEVLSPEPGTLIIRGAGADVWQGGDQFMFAYSNVTGDFSARVTIAERDFAPGSRWGRFGIMARWGCTDQTRHSFIQDVGEDPQDAVRFSTRPTRGASDDFELLTPYPELHPSQLRLDRCDNQLISYFFDETGSYGCDPGWVEVGRHDWGPDAPNTLQVGLAVTSHQGCDLTSITFTDWELLPACDSAVPLDPLARVEGYGVNSGFEVRLVRADATAINTQCDAVGLLRGRFPSDLDVTEHRDVINMVSTGCAGPTDGDDNFPGLEIGVDEDNFAAEVHGWLDLPEGNVTLQVHSDDGTTLTVGAQTVLRFANGRGCSPSTVTLSVSEAGLYPFCLLYHEGPFAAELEFLQLFPSGKVLPVNTLEQPGAVRAFRAHSLEEEPRVKCCPSCSEVAHADIPPESVVEGGLCVPGFEVTLVRAQAPAVIANQDDARRLLAGEIPSDLTVTEHRSVIDFMDPLPGGEGTVEPYPGLDGNVDTNSFAVRVRGWLDLPAGIVGLAVRSDDGFTLTVGGVQVQQFFGNRGADTSPVILRVAEAGSYPIELVHHEAGGNAALSLLQMLDIDCPQCGRAPLVNAVGNVDAIRAFVSQGTACTEPEISVVPTSLNFGNLLVGENVGRTFTVYNEGQAPLQVSNVRSTNTSFSVEGATSFTVAGGDMRSVNVTFSPSAAREEMGEVLISSNDEDEPTVSVLVQGEGLAPDISVDPVEIDFPGVSVGESVTRQFTVQNVGNALLRVTNLSSTNGRFVVASGGFTLEPSQPRSVDVTFQPNTAQQETGEIRVVSDDPDEGTVVVVLRGEGLMPEMPDIEVNPVDIDFEEVAVGESAMRQLTIQNVGNASLQVTGLTSTNSLFTVPAGGFSLSPSEVRNLDVTFEPDVARQETGEIRVASNDPDESVVTVTVTGEGVQLGPRFELGFADCPEGDSPGFEGTTYKNTIDCTLTSSNNPTAKTPNPIGALAWSISLVSEGADITDITTDGTVAATASFQRNGTAKNGQGAVSVVVLSFAEDVWLPVEGTEVIARITVEAEFPERGNRSLVRLSYEDGQSTSKSPKPVDNRVTYLDPMTKQRPSADPERRECSFMLLAFEPHWLPYDANGDGKLDISDPLWHLNFQFGGGPAPGCRTAMDHNGDGRLDISDPVAALAFLFSGGPAHADGRDCRHYADCSSSPLCEVPEAPAPQVKGFIVLGLNKQGYHEYEHAVTGMVFVLLPGGQFNMGSPADEPGRFPSEGPVHEVTLSSFLIGKYEVTQAEWASVVNAHKLNLDPEPSLEAVPQKPVDTVNWDEAWTFAQAADARFRLPTEAQWEYACRAGTTELFSFPDGEQGCDLERTTGFPCDPCETHQGYAWHCGTDSESALSHPVGQLEPNDFGLHDMHGNVWEWCEDRYDPVFYTTAAATQVDPVNDPFPSPAEGERRVARGGYAGGPPRACRSAFRGPNARDFRFRALGVRLVMPLEP